MVMKLPESIFSSLQKNMICLLDGHFNILIFFSMLIDGANLISDYTFEKKITISGILVQYQ